MSQYNASSARSRSSVRSEPVGANCDSPEPNPNTTRRSEEPEDRFIKGCRQKGRWINVAICFGVDLQDIFRLGIRSEMQNLDADDDDNDDDDDDEYRNTSARERGLLLTAYRAIMKLIPKLTNILTYQADADTDYIYDVISAMQEGCNAARSEAIKRIKDNTIRYLAAGRTPIKVDAQVEHKALRGLNDHNIGRLLIPAQDLHEWETDPDATRAAYISGILTIWGVDMPVFLYEDYTYNPEDPEEGLFRGPFLVCVLIDILFGSNAVDVKCAKRDEQPRHHCLGEMYSLMTISPENIAYAAVVARFSLSSKRMWSLKDDHFNYRTFYQEIVLRLTDRDDPWVQDTLAWWNERVFGNERGKVLVDDASDQQQEKWHQFVRRQAGRKAALKATEARILATGGSVSTWYASRGDTDPSHGNTEALTPQGLSEDASLSPSGNVDSNATHGSPSTPTSRPNPVINPRLLDTPDLDSSTLTQPSPPVPQTPDAPRPFLQHDSSPLSNTSDGGATAERNREIQGLKRKKPASNADRPKTRARRKAARA